MSDIDKFNTNRPFRESDFNSRIPRYNDDSDYTTNAPSYYDDLARKNHLIKELAKRIWEYDKKLNESLENIENILNEYIDIVDGKLEIIDRLIGEGFNDRIEELLREWVRDGTLENIINEEIFNKKVDVDSLNDIGISIKNPPYPLKGAVGDGVTDDSEAIKILHEYANENGFNVYYGNHTYFMGQCLNIPIKTNRSEERRVGKECRSMM